jgi:hypothetical protein
MQTATNTQHRLTEMLILSIIVITTEFLRAPQAAVRRFEHIGEMISPVDAPRMLTAANSLTRVSRPGVAGYQRVFLPEASSRRLSERAVVI